MRAVLCEVRVLWGAHLCDQGVTLEVREGLLHLLLLNAQEGVPLGCAAMARLLRTEVLATDRRVDWALAVGGGGGRR